MSRRRDYVIGTGLFLLPLVVISLGLLFPPLVPIGLLGLAITAPLSYRLFRYPSTRHSSLGDIVAATRSEAGAGPLGTGGALICFSGIDGSGKTTEAEKVVQELTDAGIDATHVWARWRPFVSYPFMGLLYILFGWRRKDYHRSRLVCRVWGYILFIDQIVFFARHIYPHLIRGRVVCVDRYVLDQLVEMRYDEVYREQPAKLIKNWLPTPDVTFLMDVPASVADDRKQDTEEMLNRLGIEEEALSYLEKRRELFLQEAGSDTRYIDTTKKLDVTHAEVVSEVWESYLRF